MKKHTTYLNIDDDWLWYIYESALGDLCDAEGLIRSYVRGYRDLKITDLLFNSFCQQSAFPSKTLGWWGDKYSQRIENGVEVDYSSQHRVKFIVDFYNTLERDPYEIAIEETRALGMNAWISVRMNDCHYNHEKTSYLHGDMYYEALKNGWFIGEHVAGHYMGECYNYAVKDVYDRMLAYVFETIDRYDMDGLELDFQRELFCFDYMKDPECHKIMTEFVSSVRGYLREKEKKCGHPIRLGVRLAREMEHNKVFGFDVEYWVKAGLVDLVVPTSRWESTDSDIQTEPWKRLVDKTGVELCVGLETLIFFPYHNSPETLRGFATQYLSAGVDGIYIYNHQRTRGEEKEVGAEELERAGVDETYEPYFASNEREKYIKDCVLACSSEEEAAKDTRRHVMTFSEQGMAPVGMKRYDPLPAKLDGSACFSLQTGTIDDSDDTVVYIGVSPETEILSIDVDKVKASALGEGSDAFICKAEACVPEHFRKTALENAKYLAYSFKAGDGNIREIEINAVGEIRYIEIKVS